jgi:N6-L-threonylcarbamoyladenine synthase
MYVLGIETSCDETAASVVRDGRRIYSNIIASSLEFHKKYGGVIPEIASRMHLDTINYVVDMALHDAGIKLRDIESIAVTDGPGLAGSLLVGLCFAKSMGLALDIPLIGINHLYAHIYSVFLNKKDSILFPFIGLVVSGGHTSLFYVKDFDRIELLGSTLDDACGEAFDKVARILGLGYPGGPIIEKLSKRGKPRIRFKCSDTDRSLDFSFSGIKTGVLYYVNKHLAGHRSQVTGLNKNSCGMRHAACGSKIIADVVASFQETAIATLIKKSFLACEMKKIKRLVIGGGVVANSRLRERFSEEARGLDIKLYFPDKIFSMDNAAMVAGLGYHLFRKGYVTDLDATPRLAS